MRRSFDMLREAETKLKSLTNNKFDVAVTTRDIPSVERFFKIFPLLGLKEEGLVKFAKWLSMQVMFLVSKSVIGLISFNTDVYDVLVLISMSMFFISFLSVTVSIYKLYKFWTSI